MKKNWEAYKESGFKAPENYFQDFEKDLFEKMGLDQQIQSSKGGFQVPKAYFENVDERLLAVPKKGRVIHINRSLVSALLTAAAIAVLVFLVFRPADTINVEGLSLTALNDYFQEEGIQDVLTADDLTQIEQSSSLFDSYSVNDDMILDLIDNQALVDEIDFQSIEK